MNQEIDRFILESSLKPEQKKYIIEAGETVLKIKLAFDCYEKNIAELMTIISPKIYLSHD